MDSAKQSAAAKEIRKRLINWDFSTVKALTAGNEQQTRFALINPFFEILGYSFENEDIVHEYSVQISDLAKGKNLKVDSVILDGKAKNPLILIECKKSDATLNETHLRQLLEYLNLVGESRIGILTNGLEYQFYLKGYTTPFLVFNIETMDSLALEKLGAFHRNNFNFNDFKELADEHYFMEGFDKALAEEFLEPSADLLRSIFKKMGGKRFDEKAESKLRGLMNSFTLQNALDRLKEHESKNSKAGIVTTQEELTAFSVVRTLLASSGKLKRAQIDRVG